ncbi:MAG: efflux RND transporter periplasmic adaptor subunit [Bryobacterales bacterium]|nr:efflux RND transporter periplasmic adaptor subunit [Bryobacteraceae bacterium]MDW8129202.1 efflux RND transporter periplasmic adaptor subunit [Bryobacterales bacterium]
MTGRILLLVVALVAGFSAGYLFQGKRGATYQTDARGRKILYWVDPMHPAYKSDRPGIAPDCGMKLEPVYAEPEQTAKPKARVLYWRDPQQPDYRSDKPGLNPETGNELEPVYEGQPPGLFSLPAEKRQLIGVRYEEARVQALVQRIRAPARVAYDETRLVTVHARISGWIRNVYADFVGRHVPRGEPLLTVYSPELLATQQELLLAARARRLLEAAPDAVREHSERLLEAARQRLRRWEVSEQQIEQVLRSGQPLSEITLYAPADGFVLRRNAYAGMRVVPETELYALADLRRVWILAEVFEADAPLVHAGQSAVVRPAYGASGVFAARVSYIQPELDPVTRTLRVRLEADNPDLRLKPEMFAEVELVRQLPPQLTVPADAVLDTGERQVVFVDRGDGHVERRVVEIGERAEDRIVIRRGLRPGERIAVSGVFLLDSESQLKLGASGQGPSAADHGAHRHD